MIATTLEAIKKALDLRFEQDSNLYINKDQTEEIKKNISNGSAQNLQGLAKEHGNMILAKVILKNSWLVKTELLNKNKAVIDKIFLNIPKDFFIEISKDVRSDLAYSTPQFKNYVTNIYLESLPVSSCKDFYEKKQEREDRRIKCLTKYIVEDFAKNNPENYIYRLIDSELKKFPELENYINLKDRNFFQRIFKNIQNKRDLTKWILENKKNRDKDIFWLSSITTFDKDGFDEIINYISKNPNYNDLLTPHLIRKILSKFHYLSDFETRFISLYGKYEFSKIKTMFLEMLEPPRFKKPDLAKSIINKLERSNAHFSNSGIDLKRKILNGVQDDIAFENSEEFADDVQNANLNITKLNWLSKRLQKTDFKIIKDIYNDYESDENVKTVLSFYLAEKINVHRVFSFIDRTVDNDDYINEIAKNIKNYHIYNINALKFAEKHYKYDLIRTIKDNLKI